MTDIVLASGNMGKVREFQSLVEQLPLNIIPQSQFDLEVAEESGLTFVENALIKARHAARHTGLAAIADDSGLVVPALDGAPGIYSSRYAGNTASDADNIDKLLATMQDLEGDKRQAFFVCVLVYLRHAKDPTPIICQGQWHGHILPQPQGNSGFGYDPVFYIDSLGKTAAELDKAEKNLLSHRGQAMRQLIPQLVNN